MTTPDLLAALAPVLGVLDRLGVRYFVAGSIASSAHGVPRASIDADVVAALERLHVEPLVAALRDTYYVPELRVADAIANQTSFNVIHLDTMVKVDVFVATDTAADRQALDRARPAPFEGGAQFPVCSAEDTVLAKLHWFRRGGDVSERQWTDVLGLLRIASPLDMSYLRQGAAARGVSGLLDRAIAEAAAI